MPSLLFSVCVMNTRNDNYFIDASYLGTKNGKYYYFSEPTDCPDEKTIGGKTNLRTYLALINDVQQVKASFKYIK